MGKGAQGITDQQRTISWDEVKKHTSRDDKWIVIDNGVYDISRWQKKHPGGAKIISHYAGEDATEAFVAFHNDMAQVRKYLKPIHVGVIEQHPNTKTDAIRKDFAELRETVEAKGYFKPSATFFCLMIGHILMFEVLAYVIMRQYGTSWLPYLASLLCSSIVQGQASWTQHDFGHLSVFKRTWLNKALHEFLMAFTKGASSTWWNHMHYQHHAKPNVMDKDPDVRLQPLFVLGDTMAKKMAKKDTGFNYRYQHRYFFALGPPLLFPVYFQYMIFHHTITRRQWLDLAIVLAFFAKLEYLYSPFLGVFGALAYYFAYRCIESHWFVWVSQSNHIPMEIEPEQNRTWLEMQLAATCNVEKSVFNDWFTGHLNFQIEHHLFPTMPRHNLYKVAPLVKALCEKHGIKYQVKPLLTAFGDIVRRLEDSGKSWAEYKDAYHLQ